MSPSMSVAACVATLDQDRSLWQARVYLSDKVRVKVTARRFKGTRSESRRYTTDYVLTIGRFDYQDRQRRKQGKVVLGSVYTKELPVRNKKQAKRG